MAKVVTVSNKRVKDLGGLYMDLLKQSFAVQNVAADRGGTYIHMEDTEDKDPTALVGIWADKPAPEYSKREVRKMKEDLDTLPTQPQMLHAEPGENTVVAEVPPPAEEQAAGPAGEGFVKKLFRKLFT